MKIKYFIAVFLVAVLPVLIGLWLYSIKDQHFGYSNVCSHFLHPEICGEGD
jgi:nitrite reductase/ring-hydroxylating ferredoxin subunit